VIIDCHGHYTTVPAAHTNWRTTQLAAWEAGEATPEYPNISDDEIRESIEGSQLRLMREPFVGRASADAEESVTQFVTRRLGRELLDYAIEPFVEHERGAALVLCRTSNPGSGDFQLLDACGADDTPPAPVFVHVARRVTQRWGSTGRVGFVVGATYPRNTFGI